jgi:tRNA (mo5U34)-methyltransferase
VSGGATGDTAALRAEVDATLWYHTLDLPGGVTTPGFFDLRGLDDRVLPADLGGLRCLDVGTASGFWAFAMERRGAAEVVALDLVEPAAQDWQGGRGPNEVYLAPAEDAARGLAVARRALGSRVRPLDLSVYDLDPVLHGRFDLVFVGNLLIHLRDPVGALQAIRRVTAGHVISVEAVTLLYSLLAPRAPVAQLWPEDDVRWWTPNVAAHLRWLRAAGFAAHRRGGLLRAPLGPIIGRRPRIARASLARDAAFWGATRWTGIPTSGVVGRP